MFDSGVGLESHVVSSCACAADEATVRSSLMLRGLIWYPSFLLSVVVTALLVFRTMNSLGGC